MFFRQRNVRHQVPRFEFVCVGRFSDVVFGKALPQFAGAADLGLVGMGFASEDIDVEHPPSLLSVFGGTYVQPAFACRTGICES